MGFSILNLNDFIYKMETLNLWEYFSEFARVSENADFLPEDIRIYTLEDDMTSDILAIGAVSSTYRNQQNEWHVWEFQTNSKFQNKGYGELLFKHILEDSDGIMSLCTLDSKAYGFWKHMLKKHIGVDIEECIFEDIRPEESRYLVKFNID